MDYKVDGIKDIRYSLTIVIKDNTVPWILERDKSGPFYRLLHKTTVLSHSTLFITLGHNFRCGVGHIVQKVTGYHEVWELLLLRLGNTYTCFVMGNTVDVWTTRDQHEFIR